MKYKAIIFDMDDTLFLEKYYVLSGFKQVSLFLDEQFGIGAQESYSFLENRFENYGRNKIFNLLLQKNSVNLTGVDIDSLVVRLVEVYRNHKPDITLNPIVANILKKIRKKEIKIVIATDGLPKMQRSKFYALGLDRLVDEMVCCWDYDAAKPSIQCFKIAAKMINVDIKNCIVAGDHPQHDIVPARIAGAMSYRINTGRFCNLSNDRKYPPHNEFSSLLEFFEEVIECEY